MVPLLRCVTFHVVPGKEGMPLRQRLAKAQQTKQDLQQQLDNLQQAKDDLRKQFTLAMQEEADLGRQLADSEADLERKVSDLQKQLVDSEANFGNQLTALQMQLAEAIQAKDDLQRQASETERIFQRQMEEERLRHRDEISQLRSQVQSQATSRELEFWNVPRSDVEIDSEIGVGGWGSISKGTFRGQAIAVKRLHPSIVSKDNVSRLRREVHLMAHVRHPNLLLFIAAVFDEKIDRQHPPLIILELLDIDLRRAYEDDRVSSKESDLLPIFRDVACALNYLHCLREPIIHRDLSAPNVLLEAMANNRWKAKVSDFGSANLKKLAQTAAEGAILYSAPECLPKELRGPHAPNFPQTPKIDVYSYGVLLCEVITRTLPEELGPLREKLKSMWPFMHSLVNFCTEYDPSERPTVSRILTKLNQPGRKRPVGYQIRAIAPIPHDYDPTISSMVQVSDPPRYGVLRWIGELPDVGGAVAGVEMVSLLLQTLHMCCSRYVYNLWFAGAVQEETMQGCGDGSWKGTRCFQCQSGRGFFCPLTAVRPDGRFTPVGETPRGVTALPNREECNYTTLLNYRLGQFCAILSCAALANWPMSEMADQSSEDIDVERYLGEGRGIQGNQNSCYLDATVFGLFAVSDVFDQLFLLKDDADKDAKEIADILWKGIVNPLRK